jgi:hypothetical protein
VYNLLFLPNKFWTVNVKFWVLANNGLILNGIDTFFFLSLLLGDLMISIDVNFY